MSVCLFACMYVCMHAYLWTYVWAPGVLGIWEEGLFILFSGSWGSTGNYFKGAGEQAHDFRDLGSPAKSKR